MFDFSKLKGRIVEKYGNASNFADTLGWSRTTLYLKLNNKVFFSPDDIMAVCDLLDISHEDIGIYFFTQNVSKC